MFDFSKVVDRHGTWCTQWDYVADRFGTADLLPFTISDMDFAQKFYFFQKTLAKQVNLCYTNRAVMCCYSSVGRAHPW